MKSNNAQASKPQVHSTKQQRPENKDNLDSRKNEEQQSKGNDITHNKKDTKEPGLKKNK